MPINQPVGVDVPFYSPLRYPGGKGKLAYYIQSVIHNNDLNGGHYLEPYAGGAAVALNLLQDNLMATVQLNDVDVAIYSFWRSVLQETEELCRMIRDTPVDMHMWKLQRNLLMQDHNKPSLKLAFAAFFLNRSNRSGILKAGAIGGNHQSGKWKIDVRFNKTDLINRIQKIAAFGNRISVTNLDTAELLDSLNTNHHPAAKMLIYLDPPYYQKGQGLYRNFYDHGDHMLIRAKLDRLREFNWLVSYDNVTQIKDIYRHYRQKEFNLTYTAQNKHLGSEVMIYSDKLQIPAVRLGKNYAEKSLKRDLNLQSS